MFKEFDDSGVGSFIGPIPPDIRSIPGLNLKLEIRTNEEGRSVLHFPFMSISDLHLGTKYARAKKLSHMMQNTTCDTLKVVGDDVDGEHMLKKRKWNFAPWHRQVVASVLRKRAQGTDVAKIFGNHDEDFRGREIEVEGRKTMHRSMEGKEVFGIISKNKDSYTDPKGRRFLVTHGDEYDDLVFKTDAERTFWYRLGDLGYAGLYEMDSAAEAVCKVLRIEKNFSIAAWGKNKVKNIINEKLGVRREMAKQIDLMKDFDGAIYGHSHMAGFDTTPEGKVLMNDGCCTEHVQALVHDAAGNWAVIEWHSDRLEIEEENGNKRTVFWKDLGLNAFRQPPELIEDEHSQNADRLIRLFYRSWPPLERQLLVKKIHFMQARMEQLSQAGVGVNVLNRTIERDREKLRTMASPIAGKPRRIMPVERHAANDFMPEMGLEMYA